MKPDSRLDCRGHRPVQWLHLENFVGGHQEGWGRRGAVNKDSNEGKGQRGNSVSNTASQGPEPKEKKKGRRKRDGRWEEEKFKWEKNGVSGRDHGFSATTWEFWNDSQDIPPSTWTLTVDRLL